MCSAPTIVSRNDSGHCIDDNITLKRTMQHQSGRPERKHGTERQVQYIHLKAVPALSTLRQRNPLRSHVHPVMTAVTAMVHLTMSLVVHMTMAFVTRLVVAAMVHMAKAFVTRLIVAAMVHLIMTLVVHRVVAAMVHLIMTLMIHLIMVFVAHLPLTLIAHLIMVFGNLRSLCPLLGVRAVIRGVDKKSRGLVQSGTHLSG